MKNCCFLLIFFLFLLPGYSQDEEEANLDICNDSLYLELKKKDINELQEREYVYFMNYDKACNRMKEAKYKKDKDATGRALKAFSTILGIALSVASLILMIYLINEYS